jgi:transposase
LIRDDNPEADMTVKVIGLDIAKNVFQVHGVNEAGEVVLRRRLRRSDVLRVFTEIEAAIVGIEACATAHYWARELVALGHDVRLMPPQFVKLLAWHRSNDVSRRLGTIPGIGPITASAIAATVVDANQFSSGRQFAAWLGLVPQQRSSGGKERLGGISKRGDGYPRRLLVHGARAIVGWRKRSAQTTDRWIGGLLSRRPMNVATVALANKSARIAWALMKQACEYDQRRARAT